MTLLPLKSRVYLHYESVFKLTMWICEFKYVYGDYVSDIVVKELLLYYHFN